MAEESSQPTRNQSPAQNDAPAQNRTQTSRPSLREENTSKREPILGSMKDLTSMGFTKNIEENTSKSSSYLKTLSEAIGNKDIFRPDSAVGKFFKEQIKDLEKNRRSRELQVKMWPSMETYYDSNGKYLKCNDSKWKKLTELLESLKDNGLLKVLLFFGGVFLFTVIAKVKMLWNVVRGIGLIFKGLGATIQGTKLGGLIGRVFSPIINFVKNIGSFFKPIITFISKIFTPLWNGIKSFLPIAGKALGITGKILRLFKMIPVIGQVIAVVMSLWDAVKGFFGARSILGIAEGEKISWTDRLIGMVSSMISGLFMGLIKPQTIAKFFKPWRIFYNWVEKFVFGIFTKPSETLKKAFSKIGEVFSSGWDGIKKATDWFMNNLKKTFTKLGEVFSSSWDWIKNTFNTVMDKIKSLFNLDNIKKTITANIPSADIIFGPLTSVFDKLKLFFTNMATWISSIPQMILDKLPSIGGLRKMVTNLFSSKDKKEEKTEEPKNTPVVTSDSPTTQYRIREGMKDHEKMATFMNWMSHEFSTTMANKIAAASKGEDSSTIPYPVVVN